MPGLVPGISVGAIAEAEVDTRNKSGHDMKGTARRVDPTFFEIRNPSHAPPDGGARTGN